jgi:TonB family protein
MSKSFRNADNSFGAHLAATQRQKDDGSSEIVAALSERYEILKTIAESENHVFYLARDLTISEPAAEDRSSLVRLKVLRASAAGDDRQVNLFHLEARAAAKLSHENIIKADEAEEINGIHFCAIEHRPDAETLRDLLKREGWFDVAQAIEIIKQIARALDYAHGLGVLHLTLQPEKILVEPDGKALITDFGIESQKDLLWAHQERSHHCAAQYISPEQVQCKHIDQRSDLYSLGIVIFEMLTDRVPFDSPDSILIKLKHLNRLPEPPHMFRPELPKLLCWLVMDLLKKKPDERPASVSVFQSVLQQCMASGLEVSNTVNESQASFDTSSQQAESRLVESERAQIEPHLMPGPAIFIEQETAGDSSNALVAGTEADEAANETAGIVPLIITEDDTPANEADAFADVEARSFEAQNFEAENFEARDFSDATHLDNAPLENRIAETPFENRIADTPFNRASADELNEAFLRESRIMPETVEATSRPASHRFASRRFASLAVILLIAIACIVWAMRSRGAHDSASVEKSVLATDTKNGEKTEQAQPPAELKSEASKSDLLKSQESNPQVSKPQESKPVELSTESEVKSVQSARSIAKNEPEAIDRPTKEIKPATERSNQVKSPALMPPVASTVPSTSDAGNSAQSVASGNISTSAQPVEPPPAIQPSRREETPAPKMIRRSGDVLQNSAINRVMPVYPEAARSARVSGPVTVEVTVDEEGNVVAAHAISGPDLLKDAAVNAARRWKWMPTRMDRTRVKVVGTITLNFQR